MKRATMWLRVSYWIGAVADGIVAGSMLTQAIAGRPSLLTHYLPEVPYRYAMGLAGSLMLGWTILLLWADRRPVERRGVLLITIVVVLGLMFSSLFAVWSGFMSVSAAGPLLAFQLLLIALFGSSWFFSIKQNRR